MNEDIWVGTVSEFLSEMESLVRQDEAAEAKLTAEVTMEDVLLRLRALGRAAHQQGHGPDGAFVDVSQRWYMVPDFPYLLAHMLELHETKNREYRGNDPDPLANYVNAGKAVGQKGWSYAFARMAEKMNRAGHVLPGNAAAAPDTMIDIAVMALLVLVLRLEDR